MNRLFIVLVGLLLFSLAACTSEETKPAPATPRAPVEEIPLWITSPYVEGGVAATRCVLASSSISVDQSQTAALARAELARQIELRTQVMDKTYQEKITTNKGDAIGSTFSAVSKQVADAKLRGSRPAKATYVTLNGKRHFCTMVTLDPKVTDEILDGIMDESGQTNNISPQDKDVLYQEFKAYKAQQELDEAIANQ